MVPLGAMSYSYLIKPHNVINNLICLALRTFLRRHSKKKMKADIYNASEDREKYVMQALSGRYI